MSLRFFLKKVLGASIRIEAFVGFIVDLLGFFIAYRSERTVDDGSANSGFELVLGWLLLIQEILGDLVIDLRKAPKSRMESNSVQQQAMNETLSPIK